MDNRFAIAGVAGVAVTSVLFVSSLGSLIGSSSAAEEASSTRAFVAASAGSTPPRVPQISDLWGCEAYAPPEDTTVVGLTPKDGVASDHDNQYWSPHVSTRGEALRVLDRFADLLPGTQAVGSFKRAKFAIALVPDPWHSNLGLLFDRDIDSLQMAAKDSGYDYDSEWVPWKRAQPDSGPYLADRQAQMAIERDRSACPGLLLFRRAHVTHLPTNNKGESAHEQQATEDPYADALLVFLVAERPTDGINLAEWRNAATFICKAKFDAFAATSDRAVEKSDPVPNRCGSSRDKSDASAAISNTSYELRIIGPEFSGSIPSLERALTFAPAFGVNKAVILSPSISTRSAVKQFRDWQSDNKTLATLFGTFSEPDEVQISNLIGFLRDKHHVRCSSIAILSEGETSYGRLLPDEMQTPAGQSDCKGEKSQMLLLSFPRDISDLRVAYQKASIFDSLFPKDRPMRTILPSDVGVSEHGELDSVPEFAGDVSAVEKEAWLYSAEENFKDHRTNYLILRTTNPLDALFLSRFFHRIQPEAHIVVVGADMLFPREAGASELLGDMTLTVHPMMPVEPHWSTHNDTNHAVLAGRVAAGEYFASRFLFGQDTINSLQEPFPNGTVDWLQQPSLSPYLDQAKLSPLDDMPGSPKQDPPPEHSLPPYSCPIWNQDACGNRMSPPLWLEVLGRDGYFPIKVFNGSKQEEDRAILINLEKKENRPDDGYEPSQAGAPSFYFVPPYSTKTAICLSLLLVLYQLWGLLTVCPSTSIAWAFVFHNNYRLAWQEYLRAVSSFLALLPLYETTTLRIRMLWDSGSEYWTQLAALVLGDLIAAGLLFAFMVQFGGTERKIAKEHFVFYPTQRKRARLRAGRLFLVLHFFWLIAVLLYFYHHPFRDLYPLLFRMEHLLSGVSALLPAIFLTLGLYAWIWFCMAGGLMLGPGRPELPFGDDPFGIYNPHVWRKSLRDHWEDERQSGAKGWFTKGTGALGKWSLDAFRWRFLEPRDRFGSASVVFRPAKNRLLPFEYRRLSRKIELSIYRIAHPLFFQNLTMVSLLGVFILWFNWNLRPYWGSLAIEGNFFNVCIMGLATAMALLVLLEAYRLYATYSQLRRVLLALGRSHLKDAIGRIGPLPISLWTASTNVHRVQYRLFQQQRNALKKLMALPGDPRSGFRWDSSDQILKKSWVTSTEIANHTRAELERGMAVYWWMPVKNDRWSWVPWQEPQRLPSFRLPLVSWALDSIKKAWRKIRPNRKRMPPEPRRTIRGLFRDATAHLFIRLINDWNGPVAATASISLDVRLAAEDFVALHYLSFIHVVVARLRTIAMTMAALFVSLCFAFASYPFVPHEAIRSLLVLMFFVIALVVGQVYVAMDRDEVLSVLIGGKPGKIGPEFWLKYAGFLIGPLAGIFAAQNPTLVDFVLNWLQPGSAFPR